jgi:hypothetical protein
MKKALLSLLLAVAIMPLAFAQDKTQRTIITFNPTACGSYTWTANGQTYTTDTVVHFINATDDTLFVLNLTINTPFVSNETVYSTRCTYDWRGTTYQQSGLYSDTIVPALGSGVCDSIYNLNLTLSNTETDVETVHTCGYYIWHGDTLTESGIYHDTAYNSANNCTHYDDLNLNIVSTINKYTDVANCGDYHWFDTVLTTSGTYTHLYQDTTLGCDTIYNLNLTIVVDSVEMTYDSACASKTWRGNTYTESGLYVDYDTNATTHCVTYRPLTLEIKNPRTPVLDTAIEGCNGIMFSISSRMGSTNRRFTENCIFDTTLYDHRIDRCYDSTIHINVTIHKSGYDTTYVNACDSFLWDLNKRTYYTVPTTAPSYAFATDTFGCDSMMVLMLTLKKAPVITAINGDWNIQAGETAVLYPTCTSGATYKWTYGNQTSTADTLRIPNVQGNIDVSLQATLNYNTFACHDTSWITIVTFVGIDGTESANINLYPNPTVGQLNIESAENINRVAIFNALGQQVLVNTNLGNKTVMDLTNLPKGAYTMHLALQNGETIVRKFIITK